MYRKNCAEIKLKEKEMYTVYYTIACFREESTGVDFL